MSILNLFTRSSKPSEVEQGCINAMIAGYHQQMIELHSRPDFELVPDQYTKDKARFAAMDAAQTLLLGLQKKSRDVLREKCWFYTIAMGEIVWISNEANRLQVKSAFAELRRKDAISYKMLRRLYWTYHSDFYGGKRDDGSAGVFRDHLNYPGLIFPEGNID